MKNTELVTQLRRCVGLPYMWGGIGKFISEAYITAKAKAYPAVYTDDYKNKLRRHIGARGFDCVGIIKFFLWGNSLDNNILRYKTNGIPDTSADGLMALCSPKGSDITKMPDVPGLAVGIPGQHIGVYIGNGEVIEARGINYGIVITRLTARPWKTWGYLPAVEYETVPAPAPSPAPVPAAELKVGDRVIFAGTLHYSNAGAKTGKATKLGLAVITKVAKGKKHPYHARAINEAGGYIGGVNGWVDAADIRPPLASPPAPAFAEYAATVKVLTVLRIRRGPGTNYGTNGSLRNGTKVTITAEAAGQGAKLWGRLKDGRGWIALNHTTK